jgi:hypothetical protein
MAATSSIRRPSATVLSDTRTKELFHASTFWRIVSCDRKTAVPGGPTGKPTSASSGVKPGDVPTSQPTHAATLRTRSLRKPQAPESVEIVELAAPAPLDAASPVLNVTAGGGPPHVLPGQDNPRLQDGPTRTIEQAQALREFYATDACNVLTAFAFIACFVASIIWGIVTVAQPREYTGSYPVRLQSLPDPSCRPPHLQ